MSGVGVVMDGGDLRALVDVLIPGDGGFPSGSAVGAHGLLAERLRERLGNDAIPNLLTRLQTATHGPALADLSLDQQVTAIGRFERDEPELFAAVRNVLYFSYYQSPLVVEAIRALGIDYNDAPQPRGYEMAPFDATPGRDAPLHPRGSYVATENVTRVAPLPAAARATEREQ